MSLEPDKKTGNIVEVAQRAGSFRTLVAALKAAELDRVLQGKGPFTVFAPSDTAFEKLPEGTVDSLLKDIPRLKLILTYHVIAGKYRSSDVMKMQNAETMQGKRVRFSSERGAKVNSANIVTADIEADNGIIHVIDSVLMPE